MTRRELEVLTWLSDEQRPVSHLVVLTLDALVDWVREHGGKLAHQDAAVQMRNALQAHADGRIQGTAAGNLTAFRQRRQLHR